MDERTARPGLAGPGASHEVPYSTSYFNQSLRGCVEAGRLILGQVLKNYQVGSMLDVGCGIGTWLRAAGELGIKDLTGLDGQYIDLDSVLFEPSVFVATDLSKPFRLERRFDLTVCSEVAEHFTHQRASGFVSDIAATSDVVVFSAAVPFQGGDSHFNEQWPEYWAILFRQNGFVCFDPFRDRIWNDTVAESWYAQNVFLYVKDGHDLAAKLERYRADRRSLSRVHPKIFLTNVTRSRPLASAVLESEIKDWQTIVEAYISGAIEIPSLATIMSAQLGGDDVAKFPVSRMRYRDAFEVDRQNNEERERLQKQYKEERENLRKKITLLDTRAKATETIRIKQIEWLRHQRDGLQDALASKSAELEWLRQQMAVLVGSTSWQITRPLRAVLGRTPRLARFFRITLKLVWWTVSFQLIKRLAERHREPLALSIDPQAPSIEAQVDNLEALGAFNAGWYGPDQLSIVDRFSPVYIPSGPLHQLASERYRAQTGTIIEKYYQGAPSDINLPHFIRFGPMKMFRATIDNQLPRSDVPRSADRTTYSVVTSYFEHREFFRSCAASVAALIDHDFHECGEKRVEWIVVNDDPGIDESGLRELLPTSIRDTVRIISELENGKNKGVVVPLNEAIRAASNEWLLFLDCDDRIAANATIVLDHYVRKFRSCRYISSAMIDIDEHDQYIRGRRQQHRPSDMIEVGTIAGHLKAIRRDLFDETGEFNIYYPGSQDFELALRTSLREPILIIPDYLYFYRWHPRSQSVSKIERQNRTLDVIRKSYFLRLIDQQWPQPPRVRHFPRDLKRGICFIRTQGRRLNLLAEAIQSIADQALPIVPCVIVHGDGERYELVASWAAGLKQETILLNAPEPAQRRGYPLNVGLDYLREHAAEFDFMCILDDDDILYPAFSERLTNALEFSGCDVAYGLVSQRTPWQPPQRCHLPMPPPCLAVANFIPINAYIVTTDLIVSNEIRFRQDMDYLEDWHFLLSLLEAGARFKFVPETVSEFRIIGDGNVEQRNDPKHFEECRKVVVARGEVVASKLGVGSFHRGLLEFDFDQRPPLAPWETGMLADAERTYGKFSSSASALD